MNYEKKFNEIKRSDWQTPRTNHGLFSTFISMIYEARGIKLKHMRGQQLALEYHTKNKKFEKLSKLSGGDIWEMALDCVAKHDGKNI